MAGESISFIPKTSLPKPVYGQRNFSFLISIAIVVLVVSVGVLAGAYLYSGLLDSDIAKLRSDLDKVKKEFEVTSIRNFSDMASAIDLAKTVIASHRASSKVLNLVQSNVLPSTRFSDFNFGGANSDTLILGGETNSFTALADQARVFSSSKYVRSLTISNISLRQSGSVGFSMAIVMDPQITNFVGNQTNQ